MSCTHMILFAQSPPQEPPTQCNTFQQSIRSSYRTNEWRQPAALCIFLSRPKQAGGLRFSMHILHRFS